ncbi:MAG: hypothetical protein AABZ06_11180 [Bdellovibrionota bacterium]
MILLAASAAFVGFIHSLAPGHWLPVMLMTKSRKWSVRAAAVGALVAASGHIVISNLIGLLSLFIESSFFSEGADHELERYASILMIVFGLVYGVIAYRRHAGCRGHTHHGPVFTGNVAPYLFLFSLGFSPCLAVLPVFAAAALKGVVATVMAMVCFSLGVLAALLGATILTAVGLIKLDHPVLEHYGDVITGLAVALLGVVMFFVPL